MDTASPSNFFASPAWQRFSAATVRAYHRYAAWLVSLTWARFVSYAIVLFVAVHIVKQVPPFSLSYTETVTDAGDGRRHRASVPPPAKPARPAKVPETPAPATPAPPAPAAAPSAAAATPAPPAASAAASTSHKPIVEVVHGSDTGAGKGKSININLPGVVIDTQGRTSRNDGINISIGENGIRIQSVEKAASAARAAAASAASSAAHAVAGDASSASEASVDMEVNGQRVRITVPPGGDSEDIRRAVEEAREAIVEALNDAEENRKSEAEAKAQAELDKAQVAAGRGASEDDSWFDNLGDAPPTVRVHTVSYGESLPTLTFWWILLSAILKVTYKGRMQAETKAAVLAETAEAESLRRQVIEARMAMMQAQVEPHFLFNTLASIDHLIEVDPQRASKMQRNLIALLRASMPTMREANDGGLRPLEREMAVIRPYLEILQVRMEERLTTAIDVPDGLGSAEFPPMMIQTLVENAIKHGLEPKPEGGHLAVRAEIRHGKLAVTVTDTGLGFSQAAGETAGTGVGLANIRERLAMLYGTRASLTIADNPGGGTMVTITVPYTTRTAEGEPA